MSEAVAELAEVTPQAAEATPPASEQEEAEALLQELEPDKGTPAESDSDTPSDDTPEDVDELEAAIKDGLSAEEKERIRLEIKAEEEARAKTEKAKADREADEAAQRQAFDDYMNAFKGYGDEQGFTPQQQQTIAATFRAVNGLIAPIAQRQLQRELAEAAGLEDYEWTDTSKFIADIAESRKGDHMKGMVSESKAKTEKALALLRLEKRLATDPQYRDQRFSRYQGARDTHSGVPDGLSLQLLRNATPEQYEQLKERYGSEAISRVYMQAAQ